MSPHLLAHIRSIQMRLRNRGSLNPPQGRVDLVLWVG